MRGGFHFPLYLGFWIIGGSHFPQPTSSHAGLAGMGIRQTQSVLFPYKHYNDPILILTYHRRLPLSILLFIPTQCKHIIQKHDNLRPLHNHHNNSTLARVRACNSVKSETGWNIPPILTCTAQLHVDIVIVAKHVTSSLFLVQLTRLWASVTRSYSSLCPLATTITRLALTCRSSILIATKRTVVYKCQLST